MIRPLYYAQMMRFDAQSPEVRKALRDSPYNIRIKFGVRLSLEGVRAIERALARSKVRAKPRHNSATNPA